MERVGTIEAVRSGVAAAREAGREVALVPTLGALHEGHLMLVRAAVAGDGDAARGGDAADAGRAAGGRPFVVVSIFVNPTQFAPGEDYASYPRDLEADEAALRGLGDAAPDVVYAPSVEEMYPLARAGDEGTLTRTRVVVEGLTDRLCGARRPGHFDGVCTVVAKLLHQVGPDAAYFGRKDFQQLQVVRRMVRDLDLPVSIRGVRTVREEDGLAMSSRNAYLDPDERQAALALSRALVAAVSAARERRERGEAVQPDLLRESAAGTLAVEPLARTDYVEVVDPETLAPPDDAVADPVSGTVGSSGQGLLVAIAAHVGQARLIDNVVVGDPDDEQQLLDAVDRDTTPGG